MENFRNYINGKADIESLTLTELTEMMALYPWFSTGRVVQAARTGKIDPYLALHLVNRPAPAILLHKFTPGEFAVKSEAEIINKFLEKGEHKIVAEAQGADTPVDMSQGDVQLDGEIVSENLAQIYLDQRLFDRAKEVYGKLSLLYPEKSAYFADLIEKIDHENE